MNLLPWASPWRRNAARYRGQVTGWLDCQPSWRVVGAGLVGGVGIAVPGMVYALSPLWLLCWGGLLVVLWRLGHSATPVFAEDDPRAARPQRLRDGPFVMMALPGGSFCMGSPASTDWRKSHTCWKAVSLMISSETMGTICAVRSTSDDVASDYEKPQHQVTVSGFRIAITPVTAAVYREVMGREDVSAAQAQLPAVNVSWEDAVRFCNRLSIRQGYRLCYRQHGGGWVCDWDAEGYRLSTKAEWEYACRAGTTTRYSFGDSPQRLERYAWFDQNSSRTTRKVAQKAPNSWGLYDMHGNVWEWCWDVYAPYTSRSVKNPRERKRPKSDAASWQVVRGGSFCDPPLNLRSAVRLGVFFPEDWEWNTGFRCVRVPPQP